MVAVVSQVLTDEMVEAGRALLTALDKVDLDISAALWLLEDDSKSWRLVLGSEMFARKGPKELYRSIRNILAHSSTTLPLESIYLLPADHPFLGMLSQIIATGPGISGVRMTGNTVNGRYLEDAHIYRMVRSAA